MARRSGALAALVFALALSASLAWPAGASAFMGSYAVYSGFLDLGGNPISSVPLNGTVVLDISVGSPEELTSLSITDQLPTGLVVADPANVTLSGFAGGSVTANPGSTTISMSGLSLSWVDGWVDGWVGVNVTAKSPGTKTDHLTNMNSDQGTPFIVSDTTIDVVAPPSISTVFSPGSVAASGTSNLYFTITNPAGNDAALTGVGFTDSLPAGLSVASATSSTCGGTLTTSATSTISLAGATIAVGATCTLAVSVNAQTADYYSLASAVVSDNGGSGNTATANLNVDYVAPPTIGAEFGAATISPGGSTTLDFTITNPNSDVTPDVQPDTAGVMTLSGIGFTDTLPAGLALTTPNGLTGSCGGGTITAPAGGTAISLSGATLAAGASCTFSVGVVGLAAGTYQDSTGPVSSTQGGAGSPGQASISVTAAASSPSASPTLAATPSPTSAATPSPTSAATPSPTSAATPSPTSAATLPPTSADEPRSSSGDPGMILALLAGLGAALLLAWRRRRGSVVGRRVG
jgi:uncharacterized repeat protein (TIGR01451 family)/MYXO-CTERM domain-containing protein